MLKEGLRCAKQMNTGPGGEYLPSLLAYNDVAVRREQRTDIGYSSGYAKSSRSRTGYSIRKPSSPRFVNLYSTLSSQLTLYDSRLVQNTRYQYSPNASVISLSSWINNQNASWKSPWKLLRQRSRCCSGTASIASNQCRYSVAVCAVARLGSFSTLPWTKATKSQGCSLSYKAWVGGFANTSLTLRDKVC